MATENDDSQSMNGILSNISRDVVDTSWDIPPLTFPKLQPTDSEEADGADDVLDVLGIRGGKLRRTGIFAEQFRRDHVHALVGALSRQDNGQQQVERRVILQLSLRFGHIGLKPLYDAVIAVFEGHQRAESKRWRKRTSFSENRRRSLTLYLRLAIRSTPMPKA